MKTAMLSIVCLVAGLVTAGSVHAQPPGACSGDLEKLCKGITPGGGRLLDCLKTHQSSLSPGCAQALTEAKAAVGAKRNSLPAVMSACQTDRQKLCKDVPAGGGRILGCLREHEGKLSAGCKKALAEMKG